MNLTELLDRLSPEERRELCRRRLGNETGPSDSKALADALSRHQGESNLLLELNVFQHLVLRWLATRPALKASWGEVLRELGRRVPENYLRDQLQELRLWGLADYEPSPEDGFVATHPAMATAVLRDAVSLQVHLPRLGIERVRAMCRATGHSRPPIRKDECVHLVLEAMRRPETVSSLVERLSPQARELLQWVREEGGWVGTPVMLFRVVDQAGRRGAGRPRAGLVEEPLVEMRSGRGVLYELMVRCLVLPVSRSGDDPNEYFPSAFVVPEEVAQALAGQSPFEGPQLLPPRLRSADRVDARGFALPSLLRDVGHVLGFVGSGQCEWRRDAQPYERSLKRLGKMMGAPAEGYPRLLWELAEASGLVERRAGSPRFDQALPEQVDREWLVSTLLDGWVLSRTRFGPFPFTMGYQRALHFLRALRTIPADTWITKESFQSFLAFAWPLLFAEGAQYGHPEWQDLLWHEASHLVVEDGATPDGTEVIRVPQAMQDFLRGDEEAIERLLPPWEDGWVVQADRSVIAPPNLQPAALVELWSVADLESNAGASVFRLSKPSIARALNGGMSGEKVDQLLRARSKTGLPATVDHLISDQGKQYGRIRVGEATAYVQADDPSLLERVMKDHRLQGRAWRQVAPGVACVVGAGAMDLVETLRKAGHLPVLDDGPDGRARQPQPPRPATSPWRRRRSRRRR